MLPAQRRQVRQQGIGDVLAFAQHGDGAFEIAGVPKDDSGHDEVEARRAMLLVFVGAVTDFAEPMDEYGARETVA